MPRTVAIEVRNARTHNLKGIDCDIPHGRVTVVTGPSGAGKSSLAFDTVFAEGQRRFVESMSTYARQFLDCMERPPVDEIRNVLPAVALEASNSIRNARSTVATVSNVLDVLRLLFTHLGELRCPDDGEKVRIWSAPEIAEFLAGGGAGERFTLLASVGRPRQQADHALRELVRQGYRRAWIDGAAEELTAEARWSRRLDPLLLVVGRFAASSALGRIQDAVEQARALADGEIVVRCADRRLYFGTDYGCVRCGRTFQPPVPALFSFNSPLGACERCQGFGRVIGVDRERVVPDESLTLAERPFAPWNSPAYEELYEGLVAAARASSLPVGAPLAEWSTDEVEWLWSGEGDFVNLESFFRWLERRSYKVHVRVLLARYRSYDQCPDCGGGRLRPEAAAFRLGGRTLPELLGLSVEQLDEWLGQQTWSETQRARAGTLIEDLGERVGVLSRVGLDYLTLDRQGRTLSGGEAQRIYLAAALGSGLTSTLYVLDEPTIGLHPSDSERLVELLRSLAGRGNTVLVVEHDRCVISRADHIIDLGPAAGEEGGEVLVAGPLEQVLRCDESLTGRYLRGQRDTPARRHVERRRREGGLGSKASELASRERFKILGARANNLRSLDVEFPRRSLVAVTGVSGSGKSTLIENVLFGNLQRERGVVDVDPGPCTGLTGFDELEDVVLVDQRPLGRSKRSNPVTYVKAYGEIRKLFAAAPVARLRGITAGHFSFNVDKGRCDVCRGTGEVEIDMQFMSAATVVCDACGGRRFRSDVLAVRFRDLDIAQTLELTVAQALEHFTGHKRVLRGLGHLAAAGLGYLRLGQSTATLSGGEAQRLKLASLLAEGPSGSRLLLFDEPTTGLHMADIDLLCRTLRRLVQAGHSVVVVEHSPDLIARADWIVDLGPGGGQRGGRLLFSGPLDEFLRDGSGSTAAELRRFVGGEMLAEGDLAEEKSA